VKQLLKNPISQIENDTGKLLSLNILILKGRKIELVMFHVDLFDLSENTLISLGSKFRQKLFVQALAAEGTYENISRKIGKSKSILYHYKNGRYAIRLSILRKLLALSDIDPKEARINTEYVMSNRGARVGAEFPICASAVMGGIIGHVYGDGTIPQNKVQFSYCNKEKELVDDLRRSVNNIFKTEPISTYKSKDGTYKVSYSTLVGHILIKLGVPYGNKMHSELPIPNCITCGGLAIQRAFLKALFDDDGSVMYSEKYAAHNVNLHLTRDSELESDLRNLFGQVRGLLNNFGILSSSVYTARKYFVKDKERIVLGFVINRNSELPRFSKEIGFRSPSKRDRLQKILEVIHAKKK